MCTLQCVAYCDFSSDVVITDHTETQEDLEAAVALREENGSDNYEAVQQMSCFCLTDFTRPISFDVTNGKVVLSSARYSDSE